MQLRLRPWQKSAKRRELHRTGAPQAANQAAVACSAYEGGDFGLFLIPDTFVAGAISLEGPGRREGSEEGSAEGCTSQEHPKLPSWAAAGSRLEEDPSSKEFSAFAGPLGVIDAAQMAQAASALQQSVQQSGLGPYFMQHAYAPQLAQAQLQQVRILLTAAS